MALTEDPRDEQLSFLPNDKDVAGLELENKIKLDSGVTQISKTGIFPEGVEPFKQKDKGMHFGFIGQPKPWFPPAIHRKLNKMAKGNLRPEELVTLIEETARIVADFYRVESGQAIAVGFDGHIVESAETELELLLKIQGKKFDTAIFVWRVGSESFSGWRT